MSFCARLPNWIALLAVACSISLTLTVGEVTIQDESICNTSEGVVTISVKVTAHVTSNISSNEALNVSIHKLVQKLIGDNKMLVVNICPNIFRTSFILEMSASSEGSFTDLSSSLPISVFLPAASELHATTPFHSLVNSIEPSMMPATRSSRDNIMDTTSSSQLDMSTNLISDHVTAMSGSFSSLISLEVHTTPTWRFTENNWDIQTASSIWDTQTASFEISPLIATSFQEIASYSDTTSGVLMTTTVPHITRRTSWSQLTTANIIAGSTIQDSPETVQDSSTSLSDWNKDSSTSLLDWNTLSARDIGVSPDTVSNMQASSEHSRLSSKSWPYSLRSSSIAVPSTDTGITQTSMIIPSTATGITQKWTFLSEASSRIDPSGTTGTPGSAVTTSLTTSTCALEYQQSAEDTSATLLACGTINLFYSSTSALDYMTPSYTLTTPDTITTTAVFFAPTAPTSSNVSSTTAPITINISATATSSKSAWSGQKDAELQNLLNDTANPSTLTAFQVQNFTTQILTFDRAILTSRKTAAGVLQVIENLAKVKLSVSQEAEKINKSNARLRDFLDNYTSAVNLSDGQVNVSTEGLHVQVMSLQKFQDSFNNSFSFEQLNLTVSFPDNLFPENITSDPTGARIKMIGYNSSQLFVPNQGFPKDISPKDLQPVMSVSIQERNVPNLPVIVEIQLPLIEANRSHVCVFWDSESFDWSAEGMKVQRYGTRNVTCGSNHLTSFSVLLNVNNKPVPREHEQILTYLTYIGCGVSIICLVITIITYAMFKCLNSEKPGKILLNLCTSLLLLNVTFLVGTADTSSYSDGACLAAGMLLHYSVLASLMWMLVEAVEMYQALIIVFIRYERKHLLKRCLLAWGIPIIVVSITSSVDKRVYTWDKNHNICFLTNASTVAFYTSLVAPSAAIIIVNILVFIRVARFILRPSFQIQLMNATASITPAQIRGAFGVFILLGVTWVFGPLALGEAQTAFNYLFCICNSLQGFLIFIFRCLLNQKAKMAWLHLLRTGTLRRRSVFTEFTSKGDDRRPSNTSGYLGSSTLATTTSNSNSSLNAHTHQIRSTNSLNAHTHQIRSTSSLNAHTHQIRSTNSRHPDIDDMQEDVQACVNHLFPDQDRDISCPVVTADESLLGNCLHDDCISQLTHC